LTDYFSRETSDRKPEMKPDDNEEFHWQQHSRDYCLKDWGVLNNAVYYMPAWVVQWGYWLITGRHEFDSRQCSAAAFTHMSWCYLCWSGCLLLLRVAVIHTDSSEYLVSVLFTTYFGIDVQFSGDYVSS